MLGLPRSTEIKKIITKKKVYEHFGMEMSADRRKSFDGDIARITLMNEISTVSVNLAQGDEVKAFFVVLVQLRQKEFDQQNITFIAKMFGQKLLIVLEYEGQHRLTVWQTKLLLGEWAAPDELNINLAGLNLDTVWANVVASIAGIELQQDATLDEQIALQAKREKLQREITKLEKLAWAEKQPKRKFELVQKFRELQAELLNIDGGYHG